MEVNTAQAALADRRAGTSGVAEEAREKERREGRHVMEDEWKAQRIDQKIHRVRGNIRSNEE